MKKFNFKRNRKKSQLVLSICRNCGNQMKGPYCEKCGQHLFSGIKRSVKGLTFNALENMFVLDNKLFTTLGYLLFYPGKLTLEYMRGRMVSYVHPSKLFWFITIVFFALLTSQMKEKKEEERKINTTIISKQTESDIRDDNINIDDLKQHISTYAPYMTFLLIPFFAFLMYVFFHKKNSFYVDYFAFSLHFHSFVFLLYAIYIAILLLVPSFNFHATVIFLIPLIYFLRATWVVYRPNGWALGFKTILIGFFYSITLSIVTILFIIVVAFIVDPETIKSTISEIMEDV